MLPTSLQACEHHIAQLRRKGQMVAMWPCGPSAQVASAPDEMGDRCAPPWQPSLVWTGPAQRVQLSFGDHTALVRPPVPATRVSVYGRFPSRGVRHVTTGRLMPDPSPLSPSPPGLTAQELRPGRGSGASWPRLSHRCQFPELSGAAAVGLSVSVAPSPASVWAAAAPWGT